MPSSIKSMKERKNTHHSTFDTQTPRREVGSGPRGQSIDALLLETPHSGWSVMFWKVSCFLHLSLRNAPLRRMLLWLTLGKFRMSMTSLWCNFSCPWGTWEAEFPHAVQHPQAPSKSVTLLKSVSRPLTSSGLAWASRPDLHSPIY